jgi:hypothetical protein
MLLCLDQLFDGRYDLANNLIVKAKAVEFFPKGIQKILGAGFQE